MESIKKMIIDYTVDAVKNTCLNSYYKPKKLTEILQSKISNVVVDSFGDFEKTRFINGTLYIDSKLFDCERWAYIKTLLSSYGLYCLISDGKYNIENECLATYFSSLAFNRDNYVRVSTDIGAVYSFLNHNLIKAQHMLLLDKLVGEESLAYLFSCIDSKNSFYDVLLLLTQRMSLYDSFSKVDIKRIQKCLLKLDKCNDDMKYESFKYNDINKAYNNYCHVVKTFEQNHSFGEYIKFQDDFEQNGFDTEYVSDRYGIKIHRASSKEKLLFSKLFEYINFSFDFMITSYSEFYEKMEEVIFIRKYSSDKSKTFVLKYYDLVNDLLLKSLLLPFVVSGNINYDELEEFDEILQVDKDKNKSLEDIKVLLKR